MDDNIIAQVLIAMALVAPILCAVWSVWIVYSNPVLYLQMQEIVARDGERVKQVHLKDRAFLICCGIGYAEFIFGGVHVALRSLRGYGFVGSEGWVSIADSIAAIAAVCGAFAFFAVLTRFAKLNFFDLNRRHPSV